MFEIIATVQRRMQAMAFMSPRDIGLFVRSARTDATIARFRTNAGDQYAFDAAYATGDPWASGDERYFYQRRKYDVLAGLLPEGRHFARALDLGAGLGLLARRIAERAEDVLGLDISQSAVEHARVLHLDVANLRFEQGDVCSISPALDGVFDLVVLADTLYYLPPPLTDATLKALALRIAALLAPGGLCLLANHYFFAADPVAAFHSGSIAPSHGHPASTSYQSTADRFTWYPCWRPRLTISPKCRWRV